MFKFANPYFFLLIPIMVYLFFRKKKNTGIKVPSTETIKKMKIKTKKHLIGKYLIFISTLFMVVGLARPQIVNEGVSIERNGIDMVIALDLSRSMLEQDIYPNRLEASKIILEDFAQKRINDRIGMVIFGGEAYTKIPLTLDNDLVANTIREIAIDDIVDNNKTAIGLGLGTSLNRLKKSEAKSKIIILMTDGRNNHGEISPIAATEIAKDMGIKVYTIGIGRSGRFSNVDEEVLTFIAEETNGKYYRAEDLKSFENIFKEIDSLEKTKIEKEVFFNKTELYMNIVKLALILLLIGLILEFLIFIRIP